MKFLVAGYGSIGQRHFRNLLALGEGDILFYRTHHSTLSDDELSSFPVETDLQAALAHRPDAVIVSNPTALHLDVAIPSALAGCHLFLEKPISHSLEGLDRLQDALESGGGKVYVGFQFRFHPDLLKIKRWLTDGAIGRPLSVRAHWGEYLPGWHPWEDYRQGYSARAELGGGVILTLCHPLDYLRWLLGEVSEVWAFAGHISDLQVEVDDVAEIGLRFTNGALGSLHLDYIQRPASHRLEIIGSSGTIFWDYFEGKVAIFRSQGQVRSPDWERLPAPDDFHRNNMFLDEMEHFIRVVRGEISPCCALKDGVRALQLALAARESQMRGQVISL
jgi:predicted dehydrogenase